jgi:LuxR family maltose regulon positive regulatory protein
MARPVGKINTTGTSAREEDAARAQADLVATKLIPPRPRPGVVVRPRLIRRLDDALSCRLALLSAPAGSGKTTLLGDWLARQQCPVAWVSLDDGDDDPILFWMYVTTALEGALPGATGPALALLRAPRVPPLRNITAVLLNALGAAEQPVVLVLDDYHAITDQAIHETLGYVIDHLPAHVHVLLASRTDPPLALARLRAHGEILELHADTLRFTTEEAASFLAETMGLQLSPQQTALLETRTEGWIAGLQLAALSLRGQDDVTAFLETFTGSHRYIVDYLTDEVLDRQPGHIREFLLRTSPLDRLCGPLCDAVTGTGAGQEILAYLERAHLFLIPLDHERRWFRYHALFAEALRQRLQEALPADEIAGLHRRASAWIEHEGMLRDAVTHALAGGAMDRAATLVREITEACWKRGDAAAARAVLDALPDTFVQTRPRLCLFRSWMCLVSGRFPAGNHWLDEAERSLDATAAHTEPAEHDALLGALLAIRATLARGRRVRGGDGARAPHARVSARERAHVAHVRRAQPGADRQLPRRRGGGAPGVRRGGTTERAERRRVRRKYRHRRRSRGRRRCWATASGRRSRPPCARTLQATRDIPTANGRLSHRGARRTRV